MDSSRSFNSQAFSEQIGHVFTPSCIPTFLPAWCWCWHWPSKTTWTSLSFSPFSRASYMWKPWIYQSLKKKKSSQSYPCPMLIRPFYFTELLETTALLCPIPTENGASGVDLIPNSQEWHRRKFLEVRIWPVWVGRTKRKNHKVSLWKVQEEFSCENEVSARRQLCSAFTFCKFPPQSAAIM